MGKPRRSSASAYQPRNRSNLQRQVDSLAQEQAFRNSATLAQPGEKNLADERSLAQPPLIDYDVLAAALIRQRRASATNSSPKRRNRSKSPSASSFDAFGRSHSLRRLPRSPSRSPSRSSSVSTSFYTHSVLGWLDCD